MLDGSIGGLILKPVYMFFKNIYGGLKNGRIISTLAALLLLSVIAFVFLFPFLYMMITSVKSSKDLFDTSVNWIPREFYLYNYTRALQLLNLPRHMTISVLITGVSILLRCTVCSFIGYGFARYEFPGKKIFFFFVILSIIVPVQTIILPQYLEFTALKWTGTYLPLIVPQLFGYGIRGGLFIFLFRQFFLNLPKSLEEAARIDGCGFLRTFFQIALPTVRTSVVVCMVLALVWHWNDYYEPAIYLSNPALWPLPAKLPAIYEQYLSFFGNVNNFNNEIRPETLQQQLVTEGTAMAATAIVIAPVLAAYMILQRQFMQGIERSGLVE